MLIRQITQYFGQNYERIEELKLLDAKTLTTPTPEQIKTDSKEEEPLVIYLGIMLIPVGVSDSSGNMIDVRPQEVQFRIEAENIFDAFTNYNKHAEEAIAELKQKQAERSKQSQSNLVVPNAAESQAINKMKLFVPD
jgi:hypothetical protein